MKEDYPSNNIYMSFKLMTGVNNHTKVLLLMHMMKGHSVTK